MGNVISSNETLHIITIELHVQVSSFDRSIIYHSSRSRDYIRSCLEKTTSILMQKNKYFINVSTTKIQIFFFFFLHVDSYRLSAYHSRCEMVIIRFYRTVIKSRKSLGTIRPACCSSNCIEIYTSS